jgi:hypothetical protein
MITHTAPEALPLFRVGHLERLPLGTSYVAIVHYVARLLAKLPPKTELAIDFTGVGRPVADLFLAAGLAPTLVLITGGTGGEAHDGGVVSVPKLALISRVQALLHEARLKIHKDLAEAPTLVRELQDFRVEFTAAGAVTFNARSGKHDDLVLALAIACWVAHGGGVPGAGFLEFYRSELARMTGAAEPIKTVIGVDLGQSKDPTALCVVQRVPASRLEQHPDRPRHEPPIIKPQPEPLYAKGSVERAEQDARRAAAPPPSEQWLPAP